MKQILFSLLFLPLLSLAQWHDDFSDGDFTSNPSWGGDASQFVVNSDKQLQLNGSSAGTSALCTDMSLSALDSFEWHFFIHLGFSPSANNYSRVYLTSDQQDLKSALNGYYLQFGETGSNDAVELFRQTGTTSSSICRGADGQIAASFSIGVKVIRNNTGLWTLLVDSTGGTNYKQAASGTDLNYNSSGYFGVSCTYTISNAGNFYFDNFYAGPVVTDPVPQPVDSGDVIINEVLFIVKTGGAEFVEIYNCSDKEIDLSNLRITRRDLKTLQLDPSVPLSLSGNLLSPHSYMVLTDDPSVVKDQYYTENSNAFLQINLPSLLDDEDIIVLQNQSSHILDELHYYSSWQFPLLNDVHGVSLERVNEHRLTNDSANWHSAAESAGYATPGYRNSQHDEAENGQNEITVEPEIFSPDDDGKDDILNIHFHFNTAGSVANLKVFDAKGRLVRRLVENQLIGNEGAFSWDGINDKKEKSRTGIYVLYLEVFDKTGSVREYKKSCVLASRL